MIYPKVWLSLTLLALISIEFQAKTFSAALACGVERKVTLVHFYTK